MAPRKKKISSYHFRTWHGMIAPAWFRLLARNHFAVSPARIPFALQLSVYSIVSSLLKLIQSVSFDRAIADRELSQPPIFIIGHWRTGTTYLHELLALDERYVAPNTLECFAPAHFLVSGWFFRRLSFFLPAARPMDNMLVSWDHPQEDEFALMNLGLGSPYETLLFPNHRPSCSEFLNMTEVTPDRIETWKSQLLWFLRCVSFRSEREKKPSAETIRIILKSPPHTARLRILRQMFPSAQFIHLVRNPCDVFASTVRLWRTLWETQGFQKPRFGPLPCGGPSVEEFVLDTMDLLYRDFFTEVAEIPREQFCDVRYEDLIRAPNAEIDRIYRHLGLGSLDPLLPKLNSHLRKLESYKPNAHCISEAHKAEVCRRWRWYGERYGYQNGDSVVAQ